jgi:hypothetical protein
MLFGGDRKFSTRTLNDPVSSANQQKTNLDLPRFEPKPYPATSMMQAGRPVVDPLINRNTYSPNLVNGETKGIKTKGFQSHNANALS